MPKGDWKGFSDGKAFLDDADDIVRRYAAQNSLLTFWRGEYPRKIHDTQQKFDTILVGMSDNPALPPTIIFYEIWVRDNMVNIDFIPASEAEVRSSLSGSASRARLKEVEELAQRLLNVI